MPLAMESLQTIISNDTEEKIVDFVLNNMGSIFENNFMLVVEAFIFHYYYFIIIFAILCVLFFVDLTLKN